jgi:hypothetical protein
VLKVLADAPHGCDVSSKANSQRYELRPWKSAARRSSLLASASRMLGGGHSKGHGRQKQNKGL